MYYEEKVSDMTFKNIAPMRYKAVVRKNSNELKDAMDYLLRRDKEQLITSIREKMSSVGFGDITISKLELVTASKGKWVYGDYYAHEYGAYVNGRGRPVKYSNGYKEWEIECLDKSLAVLDGMWEVPTGNGCGDTFQPLQKNNWRY